ncbi:hypothetical protein [Mesobacillus maritimus]|uniref:hypothetical protein n=1 Tax=Mesobacillus maritimus TaxID=1643336 RepID=UPI00384F0D70
MMRNKARIWPLIFSILFFMPAIVSAENTDNPLQMEELTIQVMPEFAHHPDDKKQDNPPLLIGYHGALINNSDQPQKGQIAIPLPVEEKNFKLGFIADYSKDLSEMNEIEYELDSETGTISWTTSEEIQPQELYRFVIEYYTDSIKEGKESNTLEYHFESFADIGMMNLIFVEPLKTERFKLEPEAESHQKNSYNMNMFIYMSQGMKPGEEKTIKLEYDRAEERTTGEIMDEMAGGTAKQGTSTNNEEKIPVWMIVSVVGGVSVIAAGLLIFFLRKKTTNRVEKRKMVTKESSTDIKKAKLRAMLLDGSISEEEYNQLLKSVGGKK